MARFQAWQHVPRESSWTIRGHWEELDLTAHVAMWHQSRYFEANLGGAEGQSRTDTGLPPPVFECDAIPGHKLALVIISAKIEAKNYL